MVKVTSKRLQSHSPSLPFLALGQLDNSDYAQCLKNDEFNNSSTLRDRRVMFEDKLERFLK